MLISHPFVEIIFLFFSQISMHQSHTMADAETNNHSRIKSRREDKQAAASMWSFHFPTYT